MLSGLDQCRMSLEICHPEVLLEGIWKKINNCCEGLLFYIIDNPVIFVYLNDAKLHLDGCNVSVSVSGKLKGFKQTRNESIYGHYAFCQLFKSYFVTLMYYLNMFYLHHNLEKLKFCHVFCLGTKMVLHLPNSWRK